MVSALLINIVYLHVLCLLLVLSQPVASGKHSNGESSPYKGTRLGNATVFGAMILTDPDISAVLGRDFHKVPQGVNGSTSQNAHWRIENGKKTASQLPFNVDFW